MEYNKNEKNPSSQKGDGFFVFKTIPDQKGTA